MYNHELFHQWWWSANGPNLNEITVKKLRDIVYEVANRNENRVMYGRNGCMISDAGRDYAVLRFLLLYCTLDQDYRAILEDNSNPNGRYNVWRNDEFSDRIVIINNNLHVNN
jgi:hypothetical protein